MEWVRESIPINLRVMMMMMMMISNLLFTAVAFNGKKFYPCSQKTNMLGT
jgi:hypothetical protein